MTRRRIILCVSEARARAVERMSLRAASSPLVEVALRVLRHGAIKSDLSEGVALIGLKPERKSLDRSDGSTDLLTDVIGAPHFARLSCSRLRSHLFCLTVIRLILAHHHSFGAMLPRLQSVVGSSFSCLSGSRRRRKIVAPFSCRLLKREPL